MASAAEKPWIEVRSPHFRVLSDGSEKDARRVAREFEQMRAVFAYGFFNLRLGSGTRLLVLAPRDEDSLKALAPQFWKQKGFKPAGFFQGGWEKQYAVIRLDEIAPEAYQVVYHEYVHTLLHLNFRWLPVWLDEGLAEFYANTRFEQARALVGAPSWRVRVAQSKPLLPLEILLTAGRLSPYYRDEDKAGMFYAESWLLTHYLTFGPGMEQGNKLRRFCNLLQQGGDEKKVFLEVFGDLKAVEDKLNQYERRLTMSSWVVSNPPQTNEKDFAARGLTLAETQAELGGFHLWAHDIPAARTTIQQALANDPKLGLAHEDLGFLDFADGKDEDAAREFVQAHELNGKLYLSLYYHAMLSPLARSGALSDQASLHDALLKTLDLDPEFAPAYVELARLSLSQGNPLKALALSRKAEQLEPSRAGYHLLSGRILQRLGNSAEAAASARYVAERWYGPDHDEAVELWNSVPPAERPAGEPLSEMKPKGTQTAEGKVKSVACDDKAKELTLVLARDGQLLSFRTKGAGILVGFSDTLWYGTDHFSTCHHVEGMRAVVRYKPSSDSGYAGELVEVGLREDLPEPAPSAKAEEAKPEKKP